MSGIHDHLKHLSQDDLEHLDIWVHSKGRIVFTRLLSELSAGYAAAAADTTVEGMSLDKYALTMAQKTGERKGVVTAGRYLNVTLPKHFADKKKESGGE
jgi:hypothetical protein